MARSPKIIWNVTEEADWYAAFLEGLKERKVPTPVGPGHLKEVMEAAREALKVLRVERRRSITSIDAIRGELGKRLVGNNIFPRNYLDVLRRGAAKKAIEPEIDPNLQRISELEAEITKHTSYIEELENRLETAQGRINELENQPTPMQLLQRAVAETLAMALTMAEDQKKPAGLRVPGGEPSQAGKSTTEADRRKEDIPQFERDRRKDPIAFTSAINASTPGNRPKFALIADFTGGDKANIHAAVREIADVRYLDSSNKFQGLKQFNANAGRIVVWTDHSPHDWESSLKSLGVSFHRHRGTLSSLIQHIKDSVDKMKGLK